MMFLLELRDMFQPLIFPGCCCWWKFLSRWKIGFTRPPNDPNNAPNFSSAGIVEGLGQNGFVCLGFKLSLVAVSPNLQYVPLVYQDFFAGIICCQPPITRTRTRKIHWGKRQKTTVEFTWWKVSTRKSYPYKSGSNESTRMTQYLVVGWSIHLKKIYSSKIGSIP